MALVLQDRVREISTTLGSGTLTLSGAYPGGYRTFASCVPNGSTTYYCIHNTTNGVLGEWEVGLGTYSSNTLTRDTVLSSSASGAKVSFSAGDKEVFITYPAEKAIYEEADGQTLINGGPITVVGSNVTSLPTLPAELGKFVANIDLFAQIYNLNQNSGQNASADFVAYNSDTDVNGTTYFVDMGINSPNYSSVDYPIFTPNSGYLFSLGDSGSNTSTMFVGSGDGDVRIFAGGLDTNNTVATFGTDLKSTLEGALDVGGALDVTGVATFDTFAYTAANLSSAANGTVLVTRDYVDTAVSTGIHVHTPVRVSTTGNLTATYNQPGGAGVGVNATLTNSGTNVAISIDGVSLNVTDRVLVYQQSNAVQNGAYTVTTAGNASAAWVLTRATDADTYSTQDPNGLGGGDYFYVQEGLTGAGDSYICTNEGTITFGSTAITFSQFSGAITYTGGTNINVSGQTISIDGTVGPTNGGTGVNTVTTGDLLYGSASNTWSSLAKGAANKSLVMNAGGTQVEWNAVSLNASGAVSGVLPEANGGTNNSTYVTGDTLYASGTNTLGKLGPNTTTTKKFLSQTGTGSAGQAPAWGQPAASDITGLAASATTDTTNADNISSGTLANARTTASSSNGASTIVARDASGNFSANTITANVTGSISGSAATLTTARNFQISGGATAANVSFDGSAAVNLNVTAMNASVINTGTIGNTYTTASSSNGANTIVARDASGNFTANNVTASNITAAATITGGTINNTTVGASTAAAGSFTTLNSTSATNLATSSGNVGIGTSSPSQKLDVNGSIALSTNATYLYGKTSGGTATRMFGINGGNDLYIGGIDAAVSNILFTNNGVQATLNSSGNLGLGVTPSTWTGGKALQILDASFSSLNSNDTEVLTNAYYNTGFKYYGTGLASRYVQTSGTHSWHTAPSGTAGNAITFTQAMTLDASGNLGVGVTSAGRRLSISSGSTSPVYLQITNTTAGTASGQGFELFSDGTNAGVINRQNGFLEFDTNNLERMRIDSSGNVGIGTSSPTNKLHVNSGATGTALVLESSSTYAGLNLKNSSNSGSSYIGANGTAITFDNAGAERMRIDSSGNVGIGTTTVDGAGTKFQVKGNGISTATITATSSDGGCNLTLYSGNSAADNGAVIYTNALRFANGTPSTGSFTERMRMSATGGFSVGTTADPGAGAIYATGNITAYYSDERLKTKVGSIENALDKVAQIETMVYHANETAVGLGYDASKIEVGVTAQSVQKVQPEAVKPAPIDEQYLTVQYERLVPLLIEAIKELKAEVAELKAK